MCVILANATCAFNLPVCRLKKKALESGFNAS